MIKIARTQAKIVIQSKLAKLNSFGGSITSAANNIMGASTKLSTANDFLKIEFRRILRVSILMSFQIGFSLQI